MSETERPIPPSQARIAAAARKGLFPCSNGFSAGVIILALALIGGVVSGAIGRAAPSFMAHSMENAVSLKKSPHDVIADIAAGIGKWFLPVLGAVFFAALLSAAIPAFIAKRRAGHTAVSLPKEPRSPIAIGVVRGVAAVVFVLVTLHVVSNANWHCATAQAMLACIGGVMCRIAAALGGILILVAGIELISKRYLIFRALHLDTNQARRERRIREGDERFKRRRFADARDRVR